MNKKQEFLKSIEETNAIFDKATKAQKRVIVVQDVLTRVNLGMLEPKHNFFFAFEGIGLHQIDKENINSIKCKGCFKGGLFVSFVGRVNNFSKIGSSLTNSPFNGGHEKLIEIFSWKQLALIELAYDGSQYLKFDNKEKPINITKTEYNKALEVYESYDTAEDLLIAICENIIKNKGTFKP